MENYLKILEESLQKKLQVMNQIQQYNEAQRQIFTETAPDMGKFDEYIDKKGELIDEINRLDEGFETLYANVEKQLNENRAAYATQIKRLQVLVKEVTDKSMSIQVQEARTKALIEEYFAKQKTGIAENRKSSKAVYDYYKNMSKPVYTESQFMDSRK